MRHVWTHHCSPRVRRGFTLIEAAMVTVIVGVAVVGMLQLMAAGSMANADATALTTAMGLTSNIQERSMGVKYADLFATFDNKTYSPPIDSRGVALSDLSTWKQEIDVKYVDEDRLKFDVPDTSVSPVSRITVTIRRGNETIYTANWLAAASEWP